MQVKSDTSLPSVASELQQFIANGKKRLKAILERLQWTEKDVLMDFNTNSIAVQQSEKNVNTQNENCEFSEEPTLPASYATKNTVTLTEIELASLLHVNSVQVPKKFSDLQVHFTREQKLSIYEHIVARTSKCTEPEEVLPPLITGNSTFAEIVAEKRREKKNKRRHRTSKPTHIEEVRALVELQMQALQQFLDTKIKEESQNWLPKSESARRSRSRDYKQQQLTQEHRKRRSSSKSYSYRGSRECRDRREYNLDSHSASKFENRREYHKSMRSRSSSRSRHYKSHKIDKKGSRSRSRSRKPRRHRNVRRRSRSKSRTDYKHYKSSKKSF